MKPLRLPYDLDRITTTEEPFMDKPLVSVLYDGVFIGTATFDGLFWRDDRRHRRLSRERAIRAVVRHCEYYMTQEEYVALVQEEGSHDDN
jgi:hypothetical protein